MGQPEVPAVDFIIEPLEEIAMRASGAKSEGILSVAQKGLHFELPSQKVFLNAEARGVYAQVLADFLIESLPALLGRKANETVARREAGFPTPTPTLYLEP